MNAGTINSREVCCCHRPSRRAHPKHPYNRRYRDDSLCRMRISKRSWRTGVLSIVFPWSTLAKKLRLRNLKVSAVQQRVLWMAPCGDGFAFASKSPNLRTYQLSIFNHRLSITEDHRATSTTFQRRGTCRAF